MLTWRHFSATITVLTLVSTLTAAEKAPAAMRHDSHAGEHHMPPDRIAAGDSAITALKPRAVVPPSSHMAAPQGSSSRMPIANSPRHGHHADAEHKSDMYGETEVHPGHHHHDRWITPPPKYADKHSGRWTDSAAIARGKQLFQTYCTICHGADGKGTGPAAGGLEHPPADLTNHFHMQPGDGDAYLFWRVSEGGTVEPFTSMKSAMPAFKTVLTEDQRWDVLAYVHFAFHKGFTLEMEGHTKTR